MNDLSFRNLREQKVPVRFQKVLLMLTVAEIWKSFAELF